MRRAYLIRITSMGWFWVDTERLNAPSRLQSIRKVDETPPVQSSLPTVEGAILLTRRQPGCPMHAATISPCPVPSSYPPQKSATTPQDGSCPVKAPNSPLESSRWNPSTTLSKLNPLNYMPSDLSQNRAQHQTVHLPVERTLSSIPKGDASGNWEYPSPQQMYNAMLRKGYDDTPEDAVESMVEVHNFLNEGAWAEIVEWERRFGNGLIKGWRECKRGEDGSITRPGAPTRDEEVVPPRLVKFMGRPNSRTPKASMLQFMGWIYPEKFRYVDDVVWCGKDC